MQVFKGPQEAAEACAVAVAGWLREAVVARGRATLAVSGGSTPKLMFQALVGLDVEWEKVHLFWVDERGVEPDDEQSNYRMTREHLIVPAGLAERNVHRMFGEWDAVDAAMAYSQELQEFFGEKLPVFDVVQCGMGEDGHTASLFPGEFLALDRRGVAAGLWVEKKSQWRITLLPGVILAARHLCVLATGSDKADAMLRVWRGKEDEVECPAKLLVGGEWFTDYRAAALV
ncbi:MAG TPA: 6-phosphogluconolactonase [Paludibaculum sp.]|jgi:6-phosphogluconolactonase